MELLLQEISMGKCNPVRIPRGKMSQDAYEKNLNSPALAGAEATRYRSLTMRASYLGHDRADLSEAVKCLSRRMQEPRECDVGNLKKLLRYLKGAPRVVTVFTHQKMPRHVTINVDSDHAGCLETRRSTTGMTARLGAHCLKHGSNVQSTISLSSGESE